MRRYFFLACSFACRAECRICSASSGQSPPLLYTTNLARPSAQSVARSARPVPWQSWHWQPLLLSTVSACSKFLICRPNVHSIDCSLPLGTKKLMGTNKEGALGGRECRSDRASECVGPVSLWPRRTVLLHRVVLACPGRLHRVAGIFPRGCVTLSVGEPQAHETSC